MTFRVKFHRAVEQLKALEREMDAWIATKPYTLAQHLEHKTGEHVVTALLREEPLVEWSLGIGECLYNFRSALDQLAYELAASHTAAPLPDKMAAKSEFPIFGPCAPTKDEIEKKIGGVHPDAKAIIEALQPHHRGDPGYLLDPLWLLHDLGNLDKHRAIHLVPLTTSGVQVTVRGGTINERFRAVGPVHHGAEVFRWTPATRDGVAVVEVEINSPFHVSFSQSSPAPGLEVIATLESIWQRIQNDVFGPLAPFLK